MALSTIAQVKKLLEDRKHILVTFGPHSTGDELSAALGLSLYLKKLGKRVDIVSDGFELPRQFKFLKDAERIAPQFTHLQKFIITVDVREAGVQELSYDVKDGKLRIFVTPKKGFFTKDKLRTAQSDFKYDAMFVIGAPDLESLRSVYDNNVDLFYKVPIVNIDHQPTNEHFGQINLVDLTVSSHAEIVFDLIEKMNGTKIDEDIATALLTGIIAKTRSFKTDNIRPQTLQAASRLITLGADRDFIVQNLFRTRSVSALKLWGQALSNLNADAGSGLVYTTITADDIRRTEAHKQDVPEIIDELIMSSPEAKLTLLLYEDPKAQQYTVHGILAADRGYNGLSILKEYSPTGQPHDVRFTVTDVPMTRLVKDIRQTIRENVQN